jgi:quercetin dioxygenase-like cupin family protein
MKEPAAEDFLDTLEYQTGAVVSRTIVKQKGGSVTLFAFDEGEGLSEHTAPFDALVQILDGEAKISIGGSSHAVTQGQSIVMPADIPHALHAVTRFKMLLTMIKS